MADFMFNDEQADFRVDSGIEPEDMGPIRTAISPATARTSDLGPCLYLGPEGQRCYRNAVMGSFCASHQPGTTARSRLGRPSKIVAAGAGILGVLWPYVYDFVHALMRLLHPR